MIVLDELFTLHGFELCSEILSEVELPGRIVKDGIAQGGIL